MPIGIAVVWRVRLLCRQADTRLMAAVFVQILFYFNDMIVVMALFEATPVTIIVFVRERSPAPFSSPLSQKRNFLPVFPFLEGVPTCAR